MIDETREEQAALHVLGRLDASENASFENELRSDSELRALVDDLTAAAAAVAHAAPLHRPPPELKERLLARARGETEAASQDRRVAGLPWAIAALFALSTVLLWTQRRQLGTERSMVLQDLVALEQRSTTEAETLRREIADLRGQREAELGAVQAELAALRQRDALSTVKIATLTAQVEAYSKALAVVVWDAETQRGFLKLDKFPQAAAGKDYQLWVIDPEKKVPVSAGIVPVGPDGAARTTFKPEQPIGVADKFAISIERAGGAPAPAGVIVAIGN